MDFATALEIFEDDGNVAAEFPNQLATGATGRRERVGVGDDGDGVEAALAFRDGLEDGHALRADGQAVGGVFDVASAKDAARDCAKGRANAKVRIRSVGVFAGS